MTMRMLFLVMIPCLMVGCGMETEPVDNDNLRGDQVEPCTPDDCIPLGAQLEDDCPEGTELVAGAECVDADGECVWDMWEECVPVENPDDPPYVPPPPSEGPPRPIGHGPG